MAYRQLPIKRVELTELHLDLANYRIPTPQPDEQAAMTYLFDQEDVLGLAKLIIRDGYFDNEVPIVSDIDGQFIVLEGNRRVTALKALQNPHLVPGWADSVEALLRRYAVEAADLPSFIRVVIAASREEASRHIARVHTTVSKKRWSRDQQATFYHSLLEEGQTVSAIKTNYPGTDVVRFIKMAEMRRLLAGVKFSDRTLTAYATGPDLKMSVFEYAYRNAEILRTLGVTFDDGGQLEPSGSSAAQVGAELAVKHRRALERLIRKFRDSNLDTRSPEFRRGSDENGKLVDELLGKSAAGPQEKTTSLPVPAHEDDAEERQEHADDNGNSTNQPLVEGTGQDSAPGGTPADVDDDEPAADDTPAHGADDGGQEPTGRRGPNRPQTRSRLELTGLDYSSNASINLQHRYHELRRLNLDDTPAAAAVMLRSVLESTIKFHFEATATPTTGALSAVFRTVVQTYGSDKALQASINRIQSGKAEAPGSIQWFNVVAHSADTVVAAADVHAAFRSVEPLLRRLLRPA